MLKSLEKNIFWLIRIKKIIASWYRSIHVSGVGSKLKKKGLWLWTVISISGWGVLIKPPPPSPLPPVPTHVHVYRHDERTSTSDFDIGQYILIQVYKNRDLFSIFIIFIIIFLQSYYLWSIGFKLLKRGLLWEDEVFLFFFLFCKV